MKKSSSTITNNNTKGAITMKKTSISTRVLAGVLSAVTLLSISAAAAISVSVAELNEVTVSKYKE